MAYRTDPDLLDDAEHVQDLLQEQTKLSRIFYGAMFLILLMVAILYLIWPRAMHSLVLYQGVMVWSVLVMLYAFQRLYSVSTQVKGALRRQTFRDRVTGIFDYRYLDLRLREEHARTRRYGGFTSVLCIDFDHFDRVNERFGAAAGDMVLRELAEMMNHIVRSCDVLGRIGEDEFLVVLPHTDRRQASIVADRLREHIENYALDLGEAGVIDALKASIGVAAYPVNGNTIEDVLLAADYAVAEAKEQGGDTVCMASDFMYSEGGAEKLIGGVRPRQARLLNAVPKGGEEAQEQASS